MSNLKKSLATLSPEKRRLLEQKLKQKKAQEKLFPLSFAQQRMWFLDQMQPNSALYNIPVAWEISGSLNITLFDTAIKAIIKRHEILRTTFSSKQGIGKQKISSKSQIEINHLYLNEQKGIEKEIKKQFQRGFNLQNGPLGAVTLIKKTENRFILIFVLHHIISDGWSMGVLMREFILHYQALSQQQEVQAEKLTIQYVDFADWQRKWLQGERLQNQLDYWRSQLGEPLPPVLELPVDFTRPAVMRNQGKKVYKAISSETRAQIEQHASEKGVTGFMFFMAAVQLLLHKYARQNDITVGTPVANRNRAEIQPLIGFFVNTLVIRTHFNEEMTFEQLLKQVKETTLAAYANQDLPFEMLVEEIHPERSMSHTPLFQVAMNYQNQSQQENRIPGFEIKAIEQDSGSAKFDLTFIVNETDIGYDIGLEYNTDLFLPQTASRMLGHLKNIIKQLAESPTQPLNTIILTKNEERSALLSMWDAFAWEYDQTKLIHHHFEQMAAQHPQRIALEYEQTELSFSALNTQANMLAHYLIKNGVGPEDFIGLFCNRSFEMIVAILATLKAGAAFVPLAPEYPKERLEYMISHSNIKIVLTHKPARQAWEKLTFNNEKAAVTPLFIDALDLSAEKQENPERKDITAQNLAYMIYTSGSTGLPKGILISHKNVMNFALHTQNTLKITEQDRYLQFFAFSFDGSMWEFVMTFFCGATMVIVPKEVIQSGDEIANQFEAKKITVFTATPSVLNVIPNRSFSHLRMVISGAEKCSYELVQKWAKEYTFYNVYGPTETTIVCVAHKGDVSDKETPSIGVPLHNFKAYILDEQLNPVPHGVAGELYFEGDGLARGYYNQPELTAEKFIPNPFAQKTSSQLYRTGDLVRYNTQNQIQFLGRIDFQVKIRGFRIELGEIETALMRFPAVQNVQVHAVDDETGSQRLVAYIETGDAPEPDKETLRSFLSKELPEYMIPALFITLKRFPLMPNGKINRAALPKPQAHLLNAQQAYLAPVSTTEIELANLWQELLQIKQVGLLDNFFDLGGHSLLATQLLSRIKERFKREIELKLLFETTNLQQLAKALTAAENKQLNAIEKRPQGAPTLSFAQQRLWFLYQMDAQNSSYNIPIAIKAEGKFEMALFSQALQRIISRHETLRTRFTTVDGTAQLEIIKNVSLPLVITDLCSVEDQSEVVQELIFKEARHLFKLDTAPLLRVHVLKLANESHIILLNMHHIISDGWSVNVLFKEISLLYNALQTATEAKLPALPIQYSDFAWWQQNNRSLLEKQQTFWVENLKDAPPLLALPTDRPRPAVQTSNGAHYALDLGEKLSLELKAFNQKHNSTMFITLISAFRLLLSHYSGQKDILIGTPVANRNRKEIEPLIGFFVNTLVLRQILDFSHNFSTMVKNEKAHALQAFENQDMPFEKIVDALKIERHTSFSPLFQVMFAMQTTTEISAQTGALELQFMDVENKISKFDLTLNIHEHSKRVTGDVEYNSDLFDAATIERFVAQFKTLLNGLLHAPERAVAKVGIVPQSEQKVLLSFNNNKQNFKETDWLQTFHNQVQVSPNANAVYANTAPRFLNEDKYRLNFSELDDYANKLANQLLINGVGKEDIVAIYLPRSIEAIIAIIATQKVGAAYLPLDPFYPQERIAYMLQDSKAKQLITFSDMNHSALSSAANKLFIDRQEWLQNEALKTYPKLEADNLAYIIYTSGSTGKPKAVMISRGSMMHLFNNLKQTVYEKNIPTSAQISLNAPLPFDASVQQWIMIAGGHCLHLIPDDIRADGNALLSFIRKNNLDVYDCVPSQLKLLIEAGMFSDGCSIPKALLVGGEAIDFSSWEILQKAENCEAFNVYGPTECTVDATIWPIKGSYSSPVIGKVISNSAFYILDAHHKPVPLGVSGELFIAGDGLARGYLNNPDLSAEKFLPNPFSNSPGARMYATGDLACYKPDGVVAFMGRIDTQVKVRGFRIELGEIDKVLKNHEEIKEAVTLVREDTPGVKRICAYLIAANAQSEIAGLRSYLKQHLPEYMVPAIFTFLKELPLTPNKKIDVKALPVPDSARPELETTYQAPRNETETILAEIIATVLGVKNVGINDNFFELGGDSIMSIQVIARAKQAGLQLTPLHMFQNQTIARLASVAQQVEIVQAEQGMVQGTLPMLPVQKRFWEFDFGHHHHWNQSVILKSKKAISQQQLITITHAILEQHDALRLIFPIEDGKRIQQHNMQINSEAVVHYFESGPLNEEAFVELIEKEATIAQAAFNLTEGPLVKLLYFAHPMQEDRILFIVHHLVIDGVSWRILMEDFTLAFNQISAGKQTISLPAKSSSYKQWAHALKEHASSKKMEDEAAFWLAMNQQVQNQIIAEIPSGSNREQDMATITVSLNSAQTGNLLQTILKKYNAQINDILLTALLMGYARWKGGRSLLIHLENHGREPFNNTIDLSRTIGWFTSIYPLYLDFGKKYEMADQINTIKEQIAQIPSKGMGYGVLRFNNSMFAKEVKKLDTIGLLFNYLGQFDAQVEGEQNFTPADQAVGPDRGLELNRMSLIDVSGSIASGKLTMHFIYSTKQFERQSMELFAHGFINALQQIITQADKPQKSSVSASDFKRSGLDNKKLGKVLGKLGKKK